MYVHHKNVIQILGASCSQTYVKGVIKAKKGHLPLFKKKILRKEKIRKN
jgi:hypothetical protein